MINSLATIFVARGDADVGLFSHEVCYLLEYFRLV